MALAPVTAKLQLQALKGAYGIVVQVLTYGVDEALSRPYILEVTLVATAPQADRQRALGDPRLWLGQRASFSLSRPNDVARHWLGVVSQCTVVRGPTPHGVTLSLTLVPPLQLLANDVGTDIFIGHSVSELVRHLVAPALAPGGMVHWLMDISPLMEEPMEAHFCHNTSRLDALHRLLQQFGLHYWLGCDHDEHDTLRQVLVVFCKAPALVRWLPPNNRFVPLVDHPSLAQESLLSLCHSASLGPTSVRVTALDATQPAPYVTDLQVACQDGRQGATAGSQRHVASDLRRGMNGSQFQTSCHQLRAEALVQQAAGQSAQGTQASGNTLGVQPGQLLTVVGQGDRWLVTGMRHHGADGGPHGAPAFGGQDAAGYGCTLSLVALQADGSAPLSQGWPWLGPQAPMGIHSASVIGPEGEMTGPADVDNAGRVLVQLHGLTHIVPDDAAMVPAIPARVGQFWAGSGVGAFFWPRPGMEVLVGFVGSEGAEPVILGSAYNGRNGPPSPFVMAERNGIKTSQHGNELSFLDAPGREELKVSALRTLIVESQELMTTQVGFKNAMRAYLGQYRKVAALLSQEPAPMPIPKEAERACLLAGDTLCALGDQYIKGDRVGAAALAHEAKKNGRAAEAALEPLLKHAPPAVRRKIKNWQRRGHSVLSAVSQGLQAHSSRTVSSSKIFGNAEATISGSYTAIVDHDAAHKVGKTLSVTTRKGQITAREQIVLRQKNLGMERASVLDLGPNSSLLEGSEVFVVGHEGITLQQKGCTISIKDGEIKISGKKITFQGDTVTINGRNSITLKSPSTKID